MNRERNYRDATTGQYTTAEDAAARPGETVAEAVPARHATPDVTELRRLAEAATPGPWSTAAFQLVIDVARRIDVGMCGHRDDAAFIAAANPATVLALLDERDALLDAAARLAHMTEARDNARAEVERLTGRVELVREWIDHRGVDVSDRDGAYMDGYRAAQRHALQDAAKLRRALDEEPQL